MNKDDVNLDAYSAEEELVNAITHGIGIVLGIVGTILLLLKADESAKTWSFLVYGISLVGLYTCSTIYHSVKSDKNKLLFKKLDHIGIYFLIAGTFTPFCWAVLGNEDIGPRLLLLVWGIVLAGTLFKIFFIGKFKILSLISYLGMGWLGYWMFGRLSELLPSAAINLMLYGGAFYTVGVGFYLWKNLKYHHGIWHLFVLAGSGFHFAAIYLYVGNY